MAEGEAFDLAAEEAAQEQAAESAELRQLTRDTDLEWFMSTKQGRRVMWRLLGEAGVYRLSYVRGDTHETAFAEGMRNLGLMFLQEIQRLAPDQYALMTTENAK